MAKFCTNCGKPLNEGEVCSCTTATQTTSTEATAPVAPTPVAPSQTTQATNETITKTKEATIDAFNIAKDVVVNPVSGTIRLVNNPTMIPAIILILVQGLVTGLFVYREIMAMLSDILGVMSKSVTNNIDFKPVASVVFVMVISIVLSALYAVILLGIDKIFKGNGDLTKYVNVLGARAIYTIVVTLIALVLTFVAPKYALAIAFIIAPAVSLVIIIVGAKEAMNINVDKYVFATFVFVVVAVIVYAVAVFKVGVTNFPVIKGLSETLGEGLGSITSLLGGASDLSDLF